MSHNSKELKKSIREAKKIPKRTDPFKYDTIVDPRGQWDHPGQITKIPSNKITMKGVNYPVLGVDDIGNQQMMYPGMDYTFPGQSVTEYPMAQNGKQVVAKPRTLLNVASQFVPGYEAYLDWKSMLHGMSTGDENEMYTGILGMAAPVSGKALGDVVDYTTEKTLGKNIADYNQQKRESIVNMSQHDREQLFLKYGHGGYDAWAKAGFPQLAYGGDPSLPYLTGHYQQGGWLDKYQDKGEVKGSWLPPQLRQPALQGSPKLVDKRQIPQSGMVVDKRTNQAYYFGDKGETGNFPVLTGQNPDANSNPHNLDYLSKNPKARGTPSGYYIMNTPGAAMHPSIAKEYDGRVRNIDGISAFGMPKPDAVDLAAHWTYGFHDDPKEFKRREKLYECPPGSRWTSYGCVNMQGESFDALAKAIPTADTMIVIDSKHAADKALLQKAKSRMSKKQDGGQHSIVNFLADRGVDYSKEHRAQMAKDLGIADYDFSAKKNLELLAKLKASEKNIDTVKPSREVSARPAKAVDLFYNPMVKPMGSETTGRTKINPNKVKALSQEDVEISKLLPEQQKAIRQNKLAQTHAKPADKLQATEEQGLISKTWDAVSHPFTAATNLYKYGRLPNNFTQGPRNTLDLASDVINPATYINAFGRTADAVTTGQTYKDIPAALAAAAINLTGDEAPKEWNEAGLRTAGVVGDVLLWKTGLKGVKDARIANRDIKFDNKLVVGKGENAQVFNNSKDWMKAYEKEIATTGPRPLTKKELNFLNKEIEQRGILETQRRHPLDPLSAASKALITPEAYDFGSLFKNLPKNAWETIKHGTPEATYTMGHGRTAGWNQYLGMPTKNNPYRVHPESFNELSGLQYTIPEAQLKNIHKINRKSKNAVAMAGDANTMGDQIMPAEGIRELQFYKEAITNKSRPVQEAAYERVYEDLANLQKRDALGMETGEFVYSTPELKKLLGPKSKFKYDLNTHRNLAGAETSIPDWANVTDKGFRTGDWDRYAGSHGGVGWDIKKLPGNKGEMWRMSDAWDINPLSRNENLPDWMRRLDAGRLLGGKDFTAALDYRVSPKGKNITPMIPKEYGGSTEFEEEDEYRYGGHKRLPRNKTSKNIATSLNFLQLRNHTIFGPSGKRNVYDPDSKFEEGGSNNWLEKYK